MKNIKRGKLISFLCLLATIVALNSCSNKNKYQSPPPPSVEVAFPIQDTMVHFFEYPAYTQSLNTVDLVARVSGFLESVMFRPGGDVRKGDLLFVIETQSYKDKVNESEAALSNEEASLRLAQESLERVNEAARSNAVSKMDVIKAQIAVDKAHAGVKSATAQLNQAKQNLQYCYVRAPFTGRVSKNLVDVGNFVSNSQHLATMYEDNRIYVNFNVEDTKYLILLNKLNDINTKNKDKNKIKVDIYLEQVDVTYKGLVDYVSPSVDINTGTFAMRAVVNNVSKNLSSGLYVRVKLPYETKPNALLVPEISIGSDQAGFYMYVLSDSNVVKYTHVELGATTEDNYREVISGLSKDERFVTKALLKVRDGLTVEPKVMDLERNN